MSAPPVPHRLGRYHLHTRVAVGGMAELWLANQEGPAGFAKQVAVKKILPHLAGDPQFIQMFLDEAQVAAHLNHPNVVQIFELGEENQTYFLVMEFIHGKNLRLIQRQARRSHVPIPAGVLAHVFADACNGLHYSHDLSIPGHGQLGLIHRDVSLDNILVSFDGPSKLVDFGIAKVSNLTTNTRAGVLKGKFSYMSPEQVQGLPLDRRADIYSLGVSMYEMLTGVRPFQGQSDVELLQSIVNEAPEPLRKLAPSAPEPLVAIAERCMAKDAADRFPTARAVSRELMQFARMSEVGHPEVAIFLDELFNQPEKIEPEIPMVSVVTDPALETILGDPAEKSVPSAPMQGMLPTPDPRPVISPSPTLPEGRRATRPIPAVVVPSPRAESGRSNEAPPPLPGRPMSAHAVATEEEPKTDAERPTLMWENVPSELRQVRRSSSPGAAPRRAARRAQLVVGISVGLVVVMGTAFIAWLVTAPPPKQLAAKPPPAPERVVAEAAPKTAPVVAPPKRAPSPVTPPAPPVEAEPEEPTEATPDDEGTAMTRTAPTPGDEPETIPPPPKADPPVVARAPDLSVPRPPVKAAGKPQPPKLDPAPAKTRRAAASVPSVPGRIVVRALPWAEVMMDGKVVGITPMPAIERPAGSYTVTLRNPELGQERDVDVQVSAGEETVVKVNFLK